MCVDGSQRWWWAVLGSLFASDHSPLRKITFEADFYYIDNCGHAVLLIVVMLEEQLSLG